MSLDNDKKEKLYQIGEVSRMGGISQRTLRHYNKLKLLEPDFVDDNNYRYYSLQTMLKLPVIRYLRMLGFSLKEIAPMLRSKNLSQVMRSFEKRLDKYDQEACKLAEQREALDDWNRLVSEASFVLSVKPVSIGVKYKSSADLICMPYRFTGNYAEAVVSLDFAAFVEKCDNAITGPVIIRFGSLDQARKASCDAAPCDVHLLQRAMRPIAPENTYQVKGGMYLAAYHIGPFNKFCETCDRMDAFAKRAGYHLEDGCYMRFVTDYWTTYDSNLFVSEILVPIKTDEE
ncbi:MerR family transcriptional regulator [Atopobium fossor]|uniref:MerR family transcriptional regulator n=1 Tax=Atopobium fossor TaxID=39487 RepID=UPI0003FA61C4|nr:MerR family transcriptional regulator [Atopobium fossor]